MHFYESLWLSFSSILFLVPVKDDEYDPETKREFYILREGRLNYMSLKSGGLIVMTCFLEFDLKNLNSILFLFLGDFKS